MNRRAFLKAIATVGAAAAIPTALIPKWKAREPLTGTIGAINRATYTFWRNQQVGYSGQAVYSGEAVLAAWEEVCGRYEM